MKSLTMSKYKIVGQEIDLNNRSEKIIVEDCYEGNLFKLPVKEIFKNITWLEGLSTKDKFLAGYIAGQQEGNI